MDWRHLGELLSAALPVCGGGGNDAAPTQWRIPMSKLTDTQLIILSAASQRDDRGVELPANVKGEAARKVVDKLIRAGLLEEVRASGSLPVWRRDDESGPMALCVTKNGLKAIDVEDEATAASKETGVLRLAPARTSVLRPVRCNSSRWEKEMSRRIGRPYADCFLMIASAIL
jgi:hypothetical protein